MKLQKILFALCGIVLAMCFSACKDDTDSHATRTAPENMQAVDLGLSVNWATCNVGANTPEEYGNYYAWGETKTKRKYLARNCETDSYTGQELELAKVTSNYTLRADHDAASRNWGEEWRMPTAREFDELCYNCTWQWKGNGFLITGKNGASIFLPAAGRCKGADKQGCGQDGYYWTSSSFVGQYTSYSYSFTSTVDSRQAMLRDRYMGQMVRPVLRKKPQ